MKYLGSISLINIIGLIESTGPIERDDHLTSIVEALVVKIGIVH